MAEERHRRRLVVIRRVLWIAVAVAATGSVGLALLRARSPVPAQVTASDATELTSPLVGKPMPQLDVVDLEGHSVSFDSMRGRPALVNFWATWCVPCRTEMPDIERGAHKWAGSVTVIGVDDGEDVPTIRSFLAEVGVTYTIWRDPQGQVDKRFDAPGLPYTVFLDRRGIIKRIFLGKMSPAYIDARLQEMVNASSDR